jgi:hypothetical protein
MRTFLRLAAFCLFFLMSGFGFSQTDRAPTAILQVNCPACTGQRAIVTTTDLISMDLDKLVESRIDSTGQCTLKVPVSGPLFVLITIGEGTVLGQDSVYRLYLEPGQDLTLTMQGTPTFQGTLGVANQYFYESNRISHLLHAQANKLVGTFGKLPVKEQQKIQKTFGDEFKPIHRAISEDTRISQKVKELLTRDGEFLVQWRKTHFMETDWKKMEKESNDGTSAFFQAIPVKNDYLTANMSLYAHVINHEMDLHLDTPVYYALKKERQEKNADTFPSQGKRRSWKTRILLRFGNISWQ